MSNDTHTVVTTQGWGSRLGGAFKGIIAGIVLIAVGTMLLFWNEGRTVKRAGAINDAQDVVVSISNIETVDPQYNGKLIHATGLAKTDEVLTDDRLGISQNAISLIRDVEYYQWVEDEQTKTEKNAGGSTTTTTTYSYSKEWTSSPIDSGAFQKPAGHENYVIYDISYEEWLSSQVTFGAYKVPEFLARNINTDDILNITLDPSVEAEIQNAAERSVMPKATTDNSTDNATASDLVSVASNTIYVGENSARPQVGDVRISYFYTPNTDVSIIANVVSNSFDQYVTPKGERYSAIMVGMHSSESMFQTDRQNNSILAWILRLVGTFMIYAGLSAILRPIVVLADVLPFLGNIVNIGTNAVAGIVGLAWSLLVIAFSWLFFRPILGIALLVIVGGLIAFLVMKGKKANAAAAANAPQQPTTPTE